MENVARIIKVIHKGFIRKNFIISKFDICLLLKIENLHYGQAHLMKISVSMTTKLWKYFGQFTVMRSTESASIYLFKVNNRKTRSLWEIISKLTVKTPERRSDFSVTYLPFHTICFATNYSHSSTKITNNVILSGFRTWQTI